MVDRGHGWEIGGGHAFWFWRVVGGVVGISLPALAAAVMIEPINIVAYYLGYGEEMRVKVIGGTDFSGSGGDSSRPEDPK